jgi:hypothetical protein
MLSDVDKYRAQCRPTLEESLEELKERASQIGISARSAIPQSRGGEGQDCQRIGSQPANDAPLYVLGCHINTRHVMMTTLQRLVTFVEDFGPLLDTIATDCDLLTSQEKNVKGAIRQRKDDIESFQLKRRLNELQNR